MKNSNYTIGNQSRDLPTCSAVPQPTALPRAPYNIKTVMNFKAREFFRLSKERGAP